jgi:serine/threonine protein kinase
MSPPSDIAPPRAGLGRLEPHPEQIGKYRIDHVVGRGAVGIVYKAYDVHIDRAVAIKALQPEILADIASNADTLKRFAAEVRSAGRCLHPNIVTVFDYMEENGAPYIIMEYVPAGTLESVIKSGARLPIRQVSEIMVQLLHALEHAHGKSVIHRDVKPSNILCHSAASIKVADFGIAQINTLDLTRTGRFGIVGTPNYMAPERFIGRPDDARGDLYSAGVVLFQLLTGQTPFTATDTHELMNKILNAEPASAQALRPGLSDAWVAVTKRSLARNPDDRYQTAREFLDELRAALNADTSDSTPSLDLTQYSTEIPRDRDRSGSSRGGTSQSMVERLRPDTLAELERTLAMSVGPIAKLLVKRAATESTDIQQMLTALTKPMKSESDATLFRKRAEQVLVDKGGVAAVQLAEAIRPAESAAVTAALLPVMGPIAKPLVARLVRTAVGSEDFYVRLAKELPGQKDKDMLAQLRAKFRVDNSR